MMLVEFFFTLKQIYKINVAEICDRKKITLKNICRSNREIQVLQ